MDDKTPIVTCRMCDRRGPAGIATISTKTGEIRGLCQQCVGEILYQVHRASEHPGQDCDAAPEHDAFTRQDAQDTAESVRKLFS